MSRDLKKDDNALDADLQNTIKSGWREYYEIDGVTEKDLFFCHYDKQNLIKKKYTRSLDTILSKRMGL